MCVDSAGRAEQNRRASEIKGKTERDRWRAEWVRKRMNTRSGGREEDEQEVDTRERERE